LKYSCLCQCARMLCLYFSRCTICSVDKYFVENLVLRVHNFYVKSDSKCHCIRSTKCWMLWWLVSEFSTFIKPHVWGRFVMSTYGQLWYLCRKYVFIKHLKLLQILFPFGNEKTLPLSTPIIIRKYIITPFHLQLL
jgi:hypothetical protein